MDRAHDEGPRLGCLSRRSRPTWPTGRVPIALTIQDCCKEQEVVVPRAGRVVPNLRDVSRPSTTGRPQPGLDTSAVRLRPLPAYGPRRLTTRPTPATLLGCGRSPPCQSFSTLNKKADKAGWLSLRERSSAVSSSRSADSAMALSSLRSATANLIEYLWRDIALRLPGSGGTSPHLTGRHLQTALLHV